MQGSETDIQENLKPTFIKILVFKTNYFDSKSISKIEPSFDMHPNIFKCNVDLEDHDNILRIVGNNISVEEVEYLLQREGYYCKRLKQS